MVFLSCSLPIGVELLRGLGWKDGQGIGPRVQKRKKKKKTRAPTQPSKYHIRCISLVTMTRTQIRILIVSNGSSGSTFA